MEQCFQSLLPSRKCATHTDVSTKTMVSSYPFLRGISFTLSPVPPNQGQSLGAFPCDQRFESQPDQLGFFRNAGQLHRLIQKMVVYCSASSSQFRPSFPDMQYCMYKYA